MRTNPSGVALAALVLLASSAATAQIVKPDATEENRRQAREHYSAGIEKLRVESFREAEQEFRAATRLDPLFVLAFYQLGETRMTLREYPEAVEALEGCVAAHKEVVKLNESDRGSGEKRLDEEIQTLQDSIRMYQTPTTKSVQPQNEILKLEQRLHEVEQQRRKGITVTDVPAEFSLALGSAYLRSGRMEDAEKAYAEAIRVNPRMGEAHNNLAFVYFRSARLDQAEAELKAAEKAGFAVNPRFKDDLKAARQAAPKP